VDGCTTFVFVDEKMWFCERTIILLEGGAMSGRGVIQKQIPTMQLGHSRRGGVAGWGGDESKYFLGRFSSQRVVHKVEIHGQ
jgi:hypothetical protein